VLGGGSVVTAAALLLRLAHAAAATDGCAGPTPQGHRATTTRGSWRCGCCLPVLGCNGRRSQIASQHERRGAPAEGGAARRSAARRRWACGMEAGGSRPREARSRHGGQRLAEAGARQPCLLSLKDLKVEDDKTQGPFCIYSCPLKGYGPKWHNLTSSRSQISILRVRGPKWHLATSSRAAGIFNSFI